MTMTKTPTRKRLPMMQALLVVLVAVVITTTTTFPTTTAFQWMSKFKVPTYDPHQEAIQEKFGDRKLAVITGASSGLGRKATLALLRSGEYHVIGAVRDIDKMEAVAEIDGFDLDHFTPMVCELNSFDSVRQFCKNLDEFRMTKPIDRLICNAGVYQPSLEYAKWSKDNHEQTMQINFLSHFLMVSELMEGMMASSDPRVVMVGSVTGNDNTVGGGGVYPIADLHELDGFEAGFKNPISMADGYGFIGAKAYKDSKLCLMMTANYLHAKYHKLTGISFSSMYPGCIAESPLFREKRAWFRTYFPIFMKFITGGFVGEHEAGQRLFQVAHDPRCSKSGVYWSWNGGPREGRGAEALEKGGQISGGGGAGGGWDSIFENDQSSKVLNIDTATRLFETSTDITGAKWPQLKQITSPCPTLKVIGAVTQGMVKREELKRMREMGRPGMVDGLTDEERKALKVSKKQKVAMAADRVVGGVFGNTVGRVARFASRRILGRIPDEAIKGSFYVDGVEAVDVAAEPILTKKDVVILADTLSSEQDHIIADVEGQELLEKAISEQLRKDAAIQLDEEDEALFVELYKNDSIKSDRDNASAEVNNSEETRVVV